MVQSQLKKEERVLDFIAFVLSKYEELLSDVANFFYPNHSKETFINYDPKKETNIYKFFLFETLEYDFLKSYHSEIFDIDICSNIEITDENKKIIISFLNENYRHGYPPDGNSSLDIDIQQFDLYLEEYKSLINLNKNIYVSYLSFNLISNENLLIEALNQMWNEINNIYAKSNLILQQYKNEFIKHNKNLYLINYFENFRKNDLNFVVHKNDKNEFILDYTSSIKKQLEQLTKLHKKYIYTNEIDIKACLSEYYLKLYDLKFNNIPLTENIDKISEEFSKKWTELKNYIIFLERKRFSKEEISNIINVLNNNSFKELGFKFLKNNNLKLVQLFHLLNAFYVFDFLIEKGTALNTIKDFQVIKDFQTLNDLNINEQLRKYYLNIKNQGNKHYPFINYESTLNTLSKDIQINKELLKSIPL